MDEDVEIEFAGAEIAEDVVNRWLGGADEEEGVEEGVEALENRSILPTILG